MQPGNVLKVCDTRSLVALHTLSLSELCTRFSRGQIRHLRRTLGKSGRDRHKPLRVWLDRPRMICGCRGRERKERRAKWENHRERVKSYPTGGCLFPRGGRPNTVAFTLPHNINACTPHQSCRSRCCFVRGFHAETPLVKQYLTGSNPPADHLIGRRI